MSAEARTGGAAAGVGVSATAFAKGVWGTALPFPSPLAFSFGYLLAVDRGVIAVDLGWNSDSSWQAFQLGMERAGVDLDDLIGVVVTHVHPDHYGLARRVREHSGAWIAMHSAEVPHIVADAEQSRRRVADMSAWLVECGVPDREIAEIHREETELRASFATIMPDLHLADGDEVPGTAGSLVALHTPGHTPGHLCFHERERNMLFTGDHVLPRVTPNVSRRPGYGDDPLRDYLRSLEGLKGLGNDALIMPGHEWAFDSLLPRLEFLAEHHEARSREVEDVVAGGASTVWEVAVALRWARPLEQLASRGRRQALGETHAHLHRLRNGSRLHLVAGEPQRWSLRKGIDRSLIESR